MSTFTFRVVLAVSILVLATTVAAGVVAATQPSGDEQALQPIRQPADRRVESRVNDLLAKMTLEEKLQQIQLLPDFLVTDEGVKKGLGSVLSVTDPQRIRDLQRMAVEESRLKIPILFAFDTIHGFRTVFPIPLAAGASFDPQVAFDDHTTAHASRPSSGSSRPTPRWSTSRTSRAGAGSPKPRARTRT